MARPAFRGFVADTQDALLILEGASRSYGVSLAVCSLSADSLKLAPCLVTLSPLQDADEEFSQERQTG